MLQRAVAVAERVAQAAGQEAAGLQQRLLQTQVRRLGQTCLFSTAPLPSHNQKYTGAQAALEAEQGALAACAAPDTHTGHRLADSVLSELLAASAAGRLHGKLYGTSPCIPTLLIILVHGYSETLGC